MPPTIITVATTATTAITTRNNRNNNIITTTITILNIPTILILSIILKPHDGETQPSKSRKRLGGLMTSSTAGG